jgi:hypothetical protein
MSLMRQGFVSALEVGKPLPKPVTKTTSRSPEVSVTRLEKAKDAVAAVVNRGGRPRKLNALTPAEKQRAYRERKRHAP